MKKILATILASALGLGAWGDASVVNQAELNSAISAAAAGDTITITAADTYTMPSIPQNITIVGGVDGVVFDCKGSAGSIGATPASVTFKNLSFEMGDTQYRGWQDAGDYMTFENCSFTGIFFAYNYMTFRNCTFTQTSKQYCMWTYTAPVIKYLDCTFNCMGKALKVYNEGYIQEQLVIVDGCTFNSSVDNKPAVAIDSRFCSFVAATTANNTINGFSRGISGFDEGEGARAYMVTDAVLDENDKIVSGEVNTVLPEALVTKYVATSVSVTENANGTETIGIVSQPVTNSVQSANLFGAVKISGNVASNMYVAVPFEGFEADGAARAASNVVHAANLSDGAKMFAWDKSGDKYNVYESEGRKWTTPPKVTVSAEGKAVVSEADLGYGVAAGTGVILERKSTSETVYVYGQIPTNTASVTFGAGQTLVSPPYTNGVAYVDLNASEWTGVKGAGKKRLKNLAGADYIQFRTADNSLVKYYYLEGEGWGVVPTQVSQFSEFVAEGKALIPVGTAFWYYSNADGAKVEWK